MPFEIVRNDITQMRVDAIVNAANETLLGGGGVDGSIHRAAGPDLLAECRTLGGCAVGQAKVTGGYRLPCRYVIHTVGPRWRGGHFREAELLASCYRESLRLAKERDCASVAFPLISAGAFGYPRDQALRIAMDSVRDFLLENDMMVYIVVFDRGSFQIGEKLFAKIAQYIDDRYADDHDDRSRRFNEPAFPASAPDEGDLLCAANMFVGSALSFGEAEPYSDLSMLMEQIDESFSQMLLRKIDERGLTDAQCYKRANIDRRLFNKIKNDVHYKPSKPTACAFAIALELSMDETRDMLSKAGFALSHSSKFDIIIEYFIRAGKYDVYEINEALFAFDQVLLGA